MTELKLVIDDDVLSRARVRASELGTSVDDLVREYLTSLAGQDAERGRATRDLLEMSRAATSGRGGRRWTREELHDRPDLR